MLFSFRPRPEFFAHDPSPVRSPFIDIDKMPEGLERLSPKLWSFCWFFLRQIRWPLFTLMALYFGGYIIISIMPMYARDIIQVFETETDRTAVWSRLMPIIQSFIIWVIVVQTACYHIGRVMWAHVAWTFRSLILRQLNLFIQNHSLNFFQNDFAGRLSNKLNDIAEGIRNMMRDFVFAIMYAIAQFGISVLLAFTTGPEFLIVFLLFLFNYAIILIVFLPRIMARSMATQDSKTHTTGQMVDTLTSIASVKIFARGPHEDTRLTGQLNDLSRKGRRMSFAFNKMYMFLEANNIFLWFAAFGLTIVGIENGTAQISDAALVFPVVLSIGQITWWLSDALIVFMEQAGTVQDGINTIVKPFTLLDKQDARPLQASHGAITLQDVTFAYPSRPVFENLSLTIPAGQKIGLVGPSGAGKSTLMQLLLRLHDVQEGRILIDGCDIAGVTQDSLRNHIAVIPQSSDLLHRSIRENIAYGRLDATETDIISAARKAHAHEFILSLSDHEGRGGYDAMVGERGVKLSGGQRQRIAIARAVLKNAPILLLDEATSALDSESERAIQDSLIDIMHGRTVIAIAHRLSTIARLDRLIVMEDGRIIEDGTHQELLDRNGLYARLWALQSGGFLGE